ncbi:MAG: F0F1 ATP synthase subunit B' [Rhodospirillales bacterium]|nr:F0F1 ATP synthase subunit B' [Rhodospirillales bacterium]
MPQFDPTVWSPQLVWLIITFVLLYLLMARVALPRVSSILEDREFRISDSLRRAESLKQDAESAVAAYEKLMTDARAKAQDQVHTVRERAARDAAKRHAELNDRLSAEVAAAETRIAAARDQAVGELRGLAVEVAGAAVERLVGEKLDSSAVSNAVDGAMREHA